MIVPIGTIADMKPFFYHAGERQMQRAANATERAAHVARIVAPTISPGAQAFLSAVDTLAVAGLDDRGRCWTTLVSGSSGIARATKTSLQIVGVRGDDPLAILAKGDPVGVIGIDMARRHRVRVNGVVLDSGASGLVVAVREAYGNCPQHIDAQRRIPPESSAARAVRSVLCDADLALVHATTTFFIGSVHPDRGADASHRGGPPGFLQASTTATLRFDDYAGNDMFNTLGNLLVNPTVGLSIPDTQGRHLHITGTATVHVGRPDAANGTGRSVVIQIDEIRRPTEPTLGGRPIRTAAAAS